MEEVCKRRMATVALPVISSGQFGFPSDVSADLMSDDACIHFLRTNSSSSIKVFRIVTINKAVLSSVKDKITNYNR